MPIQPLIKSRPTRGDDVVYQGGHYILSYQSGKYLIRHEDKWIQLDPAKLTLKSRTPAKSAWIYEENKVVQPPKGMIDYLVSITINGQTKEFDIKAASEGAARNAGVARLANLMGLGIPYVQAILKRHPNEIKATPK